MISQAWQDLESAADGEGERRPEGAAVSRRQADPAVVKTLKGSMPGFAGRKLGERWLRKAQEGIRRASAGPTRGDTPRGQENQEGSGLPCVVHPMHGRCRILTESKALKVKLSARWEREFA